MMKTYIVEIDAHAAFLKLGVDLKVSPIAAQSVDAFRKQLAKCVTTDLVVTALADAARAAKSRRGKKQTGNAGEIKNEGHADETK